MTHEIRISWRRAGWQKEQYRFFQTEYRARQFVEKLEGHDPLYAHLAPLEFVKTERRLVGEWEE